MSIIKFSRSLYIRLTIAALSSMRSTNCYTFFSSSIFSKLYLLRLSLNFLMMFLTSLSVTCWSTSKFSSSSSFSFLDSTYNSSTNPLPRFWYPLALEDIYPVACSSSSSSSSSSPSSCTLISCSLFRSSFD